MPRFEVSIELGNAAMSEPSEVAAALMNIANDIMYLAELHNKFLNVKDRNGNRVGTYGVRDE